MAKSEHPPRLCREIRILRFDCGRFRGPRNQAKSDFRRLSEVLTGPQNGPKSHEIAAQNHPLLKAFISNTRKIFPNVSFRVVVTTFKNIIVFLGRRMADKVT